MLGLPSMAVKLQVRECTRSGSERTAGEAGAIYVDERGRIPTLGLLARLGRDRTTAELLAFRDAQLRRLVRHAYDQAPRYRRQFDDHGVRPEDIQAADDLSRLPLRPVRSFKRCR